MIKKLAINILVFLIVCLPLFSFAQTNVLTPAQNNSNSSQTTSNSSRVTSTSSSGTGLVPCDNNTEATKCDFNALIYLINNIIDFIIFKLALPLAVLMFAYAGFKLVTSGGSSEARNSAKNVFTNTAIGLIIAIASWVIVKTFLTIMGVDNAYTSWIGL